jgi:hypothetical protein
MEQEKPNPLNPDSEQLLIERLRMDKDDFDDLQFIRRMMRKIDEPSKYSSADEFRKELRKITNGKDES